MIEALSIILFIIGWVGIGILTLRTVIYFTGQAPEDENFFLWMAVIAGPMFAVATVILCFFDIIAWLFKHSGLTKMFRKAAGFE